MAHDDDGFSRQGLGKDAVEAVGSIAAMALIGTMIFLGLRWMFSSGPRFVAGVAIIGGLWLALSWNQGRHDAARAASDAEYRANRSPISTSTSPLLTQNAPARNGTATFTETRYDARGNVISIRTMP